MTKYCCQLLLISASIDISDIIYEYKVLNRLLELHCTFDDMYDIKGLFDINAIN